MSVPSIYVSIVENVGSMKEFHIPITFFSDYRKKTIAINAIIDSGACATFMSTAFVKRHGIRTHKLLKPFPIRMADRKISQTVSRYCTVLCHVDEQCIYGKFNIANLSLKDNILLGYPWLIAMNPTFDWRKSTVSLNHNEMSQRYEKACNEEQRKNGLTPLLWNLR